jgi:DNA-binding response OmpR family regulator
MTALKDALRFILNLWPLNKSGHSAEKFHRGFQRKVFIEVNLYGGAMKKKHLVLVVDDSPTVRRLVTLALTQGGYDVITTENGEEGLETTRRETPAVILVDFVMPKMNGFEFCKNIRSDPHLCNIPIVLVTSKGKDVGKGFEENFGISYYLQKPFEPETLMKILKNVLSGRGKKSRAGSDGISAECPPPKSLQTGNTKTVEEAPSREVKPDMHGNTAVWDNISKELTTLLKSAVIQTLKETDLVQSTSRVLSGEIMYISVANIIRFAGISGISGKLSVLTDTFSSEIYLEDGQVAFASINRPGNRACLEELILKDGKSQPEEMLSCLAEARGSSLTAGSLLLEKGLITEDELSDYYRRLSEDAVNETLSATSGHFYIDDVPLPEVIQRMKWEKNKSV